MQQICKIMGYLKLQKIENIDDGTWLSYEIKKLLICASDYTFLQVIVL